MSEPRPCVLMLADISGYTRFMIANAHALAHAQVVITELIETIVAQVQIPLRVSKLEGDAVFLYAFVDGDAEREDTRELIRSRIVGFFERFSQRVAELAASTNCNCGACMHIDRLKLKLVVHGGVALEYDVAGFRELAGPDVIIVHRLLKNTVGSDEYVLMTDAAWSMVGAPPGIEMRPHLERYEDVGDVPSRVWVPNAPPEPRPVALSSEIAWNWRLYLRTLRMYLGWGSPALRNVAPESNSRSGRLYGAMLLVGAPFFTAFVPLQSLIVRSRRR